MKIQFLVILSMLSFSAFASVSEKELNDVGCVFNASKLVCSEQNKMAGYQDQLAAIKSYIGAIHQQDKATQVNLLNKSFMANQEHIQVWLRNDSLMKELIKRNELEEVIPYYQAFKAGAESAAFIPKMNCQISETEFACPAPSSKYEAAKSVLLFMDYVDSINFLIEKDSSMSAEDRAEMEALLKDVLKAQSEFTTILHQ